LNDAEIDRMVRDAESHRTEDQERRKQVEVRNQLDGMIYNTEKSFNENKEKLGPDETGELERAIAEARQALEGSETAAMEAATERLTKASHKLAEVMYAQQQQGGQPNPQGAAPGAGGASDEVIDAEYVDVDEKR
jgi:molecular chaperone DnaK